MAGSSQGARLEALEAQLEALATLQHDFATLQGHYGDLQATNADLVSRMEDLQARSQAATTEQSPEPGSRPPEPKVAAPEYFSGQRSKLKTFITQVTLVIAAQPRRYNTELAKITYMGSYLRDTAFAWFQPYVTADPPPLFMTDFKLFCRELTKVFGDPDEKGTATRQLFALRQRGSASSYLTDFRRLTAVLDWDNDALAAQFYRGLKDPIKDELARTGRPENLEDLINTVIRIDTRLFERSMEKGERIGSGSSTIPRIPPSRPIFDRKPSVTPSDRSYV